MMNGIMGFLEGKHEYLCVTDTNHNANNAQYQVIGGNYVAPIGNCLIDSIILNKALSQYLYHPNDFASDFLVLQIHSKHSDGNVLNLEDKKPSTHMRIIAIQFFNHVHLFIFN